MSELLSHDAADLDELRREIDAIDEDMHRLLMRRGEVIERLIMAKSGGETGSAFRPGREADMLRRLAARHEGKLPLATIEHVWREIIGTFTQLQAPFKVHAIRASEPALRDLLRFHFGFSTPIIDHDSPDTVISALRDSGTDLGAIALDSPQSSSWWRNLSAEPGGIKVIAAFPFLSLGEPDWPHTLVIGPAATANPDAETLVYAAEMEPQEDFEVEGLEVLASACGSSLIATRFGRDGLAHAFAGRSLAEVGSFSAPLAR